MTELAKRLLDKYGPLGLALIILAYLLMQSDKRATEDRAFFYNDLSQRIEDACKAR